MTSSAISQLLPCPFCGNAEQPRLIPDSELDRKSVVGGWWVICDAKMGEPGCGASVGWRKSEDEAVKDWNRRSLARSERTKPDACKDGCPPQTVCDYCQGVGGEDVRGDKQQACCHLGGYCTQEPPCVSPEKCVRVTNNQIETPIALKLAREVIECAEKYPAAWKGDSAGEKVILAQAVVKLSELLSSTANTDFDSLAKPNADLLQYAEEVLELDHRARESSEGRAATSTELYLAQGIKRLAISASSGGKGE